VMSVASPIDIEDSSWQSGPDEKEYILRALDEMNSVYFSAAFGKALRGHFGQCAASSPQHYPNASKEEPMITQQKKILFVASDPRDLGRLRIQDEFRMIKDELRGTVGSDQFVFELAFATRPQDLSRELLKKPRPAILHFSGHGSTEGAICLQDDSGTIQAVPGAAIAELLSQVATTLDIVVLNACYSREQADAIRNYVRHVVGMGNSISDRAAIAYAVGFYQALFSGESVPVAHAAACAQVHMVSPAEKAIPELLTKQSNA
jgi:hypothetical protein